jgi:hypothetical protein
MESEGLLAGPALESRTGMRFQAGDRIVVRTNWYANADLRNGHTGTITHVDADSGHLTFSRDHDRVEVVLPRRYVDQSVDYGYAQTIHTAQGHTYNRVHLYVDQAMTAEHGYTGLSRATGETHIWMADPPGPTGDCGHLHCRPAVENRIDSLVSQLANSGVRPAATQSPPVTETLTDSQLIDRRDQLFQLFKDGPLSEPTLDFAAVDQPTMEGGAMARHERWINEHAPLIDEYRDVLHEIDRRVAARKVLWQINPPEDLLAEIGSRTESPNPQAWDAAVAIYARTRLEVGPEVDLLDPAVRQAGQWRDMVLQSIETPPPTLRLIG